MVLRLDHITKRFGPTLAVADASFELQPGEIVALAGENGAGKTTLMRIAAAELSADSGTVRASGTVGFVHQHFLLVDAFTIAENLALATGRRDTENLIEESGIALGNIRRRVEELSVGERAKLELIKALARRPAALILDEPTSVLSPPETEELFTVLRRLASQGTGIVFISHKIPEVLQIASRFVVMRRGGVVINVRDATAEELVRAMVDLNEPPAPAATPPRPAAPPRKLHLAGIDVVAGEIMAIIGVAGNGQTEIAARLRDTMRSANVAFIPEDRTRDGIVAEMSIAENLALRGALDAHSIIEKYDIRASGPRQRAGTLSGGNQQKLILARELARNPETIVAAEPTRGLDLEATRFVHRQLRDAAARGAAILLITSDLDEALSLADGVQVIYRGHLSQRLSPADAATHAPHLMAGLT